ncbi:PCID2, partial [Symbiodinium necroappetens]
VQRYVEAEGSALWMTPLMMQLTALARRVAMQLDQAKRSERAERPDQENNAYLKKLVALYRDFLKVLNKERTKRAGHVWI